MCPACADRERTGEVGQMPGTGCNIPVGWAAQAEEKYPSRAAQVSPLQQIECFQHLRSGARSDRD